MLKRIGLLLVLVAMLAAQAAAQSAGDLLDAASKATAQVQERYIELTREIWMESHDLDHMPPLRGDETTNVGQGPRAFVKAAFQGTDLARQKFLRQTWANDAAAISKKITATRQAMEKDARLLAGREPDNVSVDENGQQTSTYSDPRMQAAYDRILENSRKLDDLNRSLSTWLDRIVVATVAIRPQLGTSTEKAPWNESLQGVWEDERGTLVYIEQRGDQIKGTLQGSARSGHPRAHGGFQGTFRNNKFEGSFANYEGDVKSTGPLYFTLTAEGRLVGHGPGTLTWPGGSRPLDIQWNFGRKGKAAE